jgi:hypothetical protein
LSGQDIQNREHELHSIDSESGQQEHAHHDPSRSEEHCVNSRSEQQEAGSKGSNSNLQGGELSSGDQSVSEREGRGQPESHSTVGGPESISTEGTDKPHHSALTHIFLESYRAHTGCN